MPLRPQDVEARAAAVRAILEYVKHANNPVFGISPEGHNPPNGVLMSPAPGFGRLALLPSKAGMRFIPVGGYEEDGIFHLHFGKQYELRICSDLATDEKDDRAMRIIMGNIACLLPTSLRGEFA